MANLLYSTNFENVIKVGNATMTADGATLPISFNIAPVQMSFWMEGLDRNSGITPHSGSRCVGMEHFATGTYYEFDMPLNITALNPAGTEFFVSGWHYLPVGFSVANWFKLFTLLLGQNLNPAIDVIFTPSGDSFIATLVQIVNGVRTDTNTYVSIPKGRWFRVAYYVKMDAVNGEIRVWVDDIEIFAKTNIVTKSDASAYITYPTSLTCSVPVGTTLPLQAFTDDIEVYDGLPSILNPLTASISPASAEIGVGQLQTFTAVITGGTAPYRFQWFVNDLPISGAVGQAYSITPSVEGTYSISLSVIDADSTTVTSTATLTATIQTVTGTLQANAHLNQTSVIASVTVVDSSGNSVGVYDTPFSIPLNIGTYTLTAVYNGVTRTQNVTIIANQASSVDFQFGGTTVDVFPLAIVIGAGAVLASLVFVAVRK